MGNDDSSDEQKDDHEHGGLLLKMNNDETLPCKDDLPTKSSKLLDSSNGKWLQIVKKSHGPSIFSSKIPKDLLSVDEKYLHRCLELIHITASKSTHCSFSVNFMGSVKMGISSHHFDSAAALKANNTCDVSPDPCLLRSREQDDLNSHIRSNQSEIMCKRVVSELSKNSSFSSYEHSFRSASMNVSRGALQFSMNDHGLPRLVFSLDGKKEIFEAILSNGDMGFNSSALEYTYLIYQRKSNGGNDRNLVGKIKVSTLLYFSSSSNCRFMEREFVLFSNGCDWHIECNDPKKNKGLPKKVVEAFKGFRASRQRSSRFSRASSIADLCSWEKFQNPNYDPEPVNLLDNDLPPNLESLAIVIKEQIPEEPSQEELGGWGMKFLKKTSFSNGSEDSKHSTTMDVIIPAGIHGGPRERNDGPSNLIQRWKSGGICDCGGWDTGCALTVLKGEPRTYQCNLFELFMEDGRPGLKIENAHKGLYLVEWQSEISLLQSFSIAVGHIHSQQWPGNVQKRKLAKRAPDNDVLVL